MTRWGDLSLNGNTNLSTPNIDSIGKEGAILTGFMFVRYVHRHRAEFLTGRYHVRSGVYSTSAGGERMDLDETTIADLFKKRVMQREPLENGTTACNILTILLAAV